MGASQEYMSKKKMFYNNANIFTSPYLELTYFVNYWLRFRLKAFVVQEAIFLLTFISMQL